MKHLKISVRTLAKICGVSDGTVDRAINGRADINEDTKKRILAAAKTYGYRDVAPTNQSEVSEQIGIIIFDLGNDYFANLITETEQILRDNGYCAAVMMTHYDKKREIECIRNMYNMGVKGIILCSVGSGAEFENYLKLFDIPIVAVGNDTGLLPYVGINDREAMRDMVEEVISEGYKKLVYFSPPLKYENAFAQQRRYEGFLDAARGTDFEVVTDDEKLRADYDNLTAVICSTDYYAMRAYFKVGSAKVVGFDNLPSIKKFRLNIDSVGYSMKKIAESALDIIFGKKQNGRIIPHFIEKHKF